MARFKMLRRTLARAYQASQASQASRLDVDGRERGGRDGHSLRSSGYQAGEAAGTGGASAASGPTPEAPPHTSVSSGDDAAVPPGLRVAAAWAWRMLLLVAAAAVALWLIGRLKTVLIPLSIALLLTALLAPPVGFLRRRVRLPRSLGTALVLVGGLAAVVATLTLVVNQFIEGVPGLSSKAGKGLGEIRSWLQEGPAHLSNRQVNEALDDTLATAGRWLQNNSDAVTSGALSTAVATIEVLASAFLVLFATFFFLRDGDRIWSFLVRFFPGPARQPLASAGEAAWLTLVAYVRATVLVAFIDAVGIGLVLLICRVDLALPLAALVFLAAFIPIVGATVSGSVAVLVALVDEGGWIALIVLGAVIAVQQIEGHVLQPIIMGRAVAIHPLAVILAIATGVMLAGIIGALVSVPIVAVLNTGVRHVVERRRGEPPPGAVVVASSAPGS